MGLAVMWLDECNHHPRRDGSDTDFGRRDRRPGWYVCIEHTSKVIPLAFARELDAYAAMLSIADEIDWDADDEAVRVQAVEYGLGRLRKKMVESMGW